MTLTGESTKASEGVAPQDQPSQTALEASTSQELSKTRTHTEADVTKMVSDALAEQGRKHKLALTAAERRAESRANETLAELKDENDKLQKVIDELSTDDEDKTRLTRLLRENKQEQDNIKKLKQQWEPRIAKAEEWELTTMCAEIAGDYEGGDPVKLGRLASKLKFTDDEDRTDEIRALADDLWHKKSAAPPPKNEEAPPRKVDSGVTTGKTGRKPTLAEVQATSPDEVVAKFASGEWTR